MRLHSKLASRLLSVGRTIFLQAVGFLLHRLMPIGCNQLAVSIVILPGDVRLVARLTVMPPELHQQMRCLHGLLHFGYILQNGTGDAVGVQMVVLGNAVVLPETCGILARGHEEVSGEHLRKFIGKLRDNLVQYTESVVLFIHTSFLRTEFLLPRFLCMNEKMMFLTETNSVFESLTAVLMSRIHVVVMLDALLAEQAVAFLHIEDGFFDASLSIEWASLILPSLNMRIAQLHEREAVDLQHDVRDGKELLYLLHQIDVAQQQVVRRGGKPSCGADPVIEPGFLVADALTMDRLLTSWKDSPDDLL